MWSVLPRFLLRFLPAPLRGSRGRNAPDGTETRPPLEEGLPAEDTLCGGEEAVRLAAADTLDLHAFAPRDVPSVVEEFLEAALRDGFLRVRIIHGKGIGVQREIVRAILGRHPSVVSFSDAGDASGWGATVAVLTPRPPPRSEM